MKIGILTFHAVYNYGAVLQAYALQKTLEDLGAEAEIIDLRRPEQNASTGMYSMRNGIKSMCKNVLLLPLHKKRKRRTIQFQTFLKQHLKLSACYTKEDELNGLDEIYDCVISGSDQVWNTTKKLDFCKAYMLNFIQNKRCRKLGYAVSIGSAQMADLESYKTDIAQFDFITMRETRGAEMIGQLIGEIPPVVIDPTLLVENSHYAELYDSVTGAEKNNYIFYYSLDGFDKKKRNFDILEQLSEKFHLKVKAVLPERPFSYKNFEMITDAGLEDFLALIKNAAFVCTNSFHGTALSIALQKPFFVLETYDGNDDRKLTLLKRLRCEDRMIGSLTEAQNILEYSMDYITISEELRKYREESLALLKKMVGFEE